MAFAEPQPAVAVASSLQRQRYEDFASGANKSLKIHLFRGVFSTLFLQKNPVVCGRSKVSGYSEQTGWFGRSKYIFFPGRLCVSHTQTAIYYFITILRYYFIIF